MNGPDGKNIMAIGGATMGISAVLIFICICMFYSMSTTYADITPLLILVPLLMLAFLAGFGILFVGVIIFAVQSGKQSKKTEKPSVLNVKETTEPSVSYEKTEDTAGMVTCPYCGKEQRKNSFGCIYCHEKF